MMSVKYRDPNSNRLVSQKIFGIANAIQEKDPGIAFCDTKKIVVIAYLWLTISILQEQFIRLLSSAQET